ncbi:MAG: fumarylacetoacetate hydrolase family protein [Halobacteriales archaeon]|nr:fumarylacetoacetate hydrolase family protein [Halobacteriales archaeon]
MRYYRVPDNGDSRLIAIRGTGDEATAADLSASEPTVTSVADLAARDEELDAAAESLFETAPRVDPEGVKRRALTVGASEIWAAGVTYQISEEAREAESGMPDLYLDVYEADRPELFFKATPSRTVGSMDAIGIRADSGWDVPEPELGIVLVEGEIVGYTIGNDVSSRSIEGENALYLPQAKVYERCCAIGPCVASPATVGDPHDLELTMTIERDESAVFEGTATTDDMVRTVEELTDYLTRHNVLPELCVLLTGTSLVPPEEFTLEPGDWVTIDIEGIGTLENTVVTV